MENMMGSPTPDEASAALTDAEASRTKLTGGLALPSHFHVSIGAAIAIQIATAAVGIADGTAPALWLLVGGIVVFAAVAVGQLVRFRRLNGVWLGGLASRAVLGTANSTSLAYMAAFAAAVWAGFAGLWWLSALCSLGGGVVYALSSRRWLRLYREDPVTYARGESAWQLAAIGAVAVAGAVFLMIGR